MNKTQRLFTTWFAYLRSIGAKQAFQAIAADAEQGKPNSTVFRAGIINLLDAADKAAADNNPDDLVGLSGRSDTVTVPRCYFAAGVRAYATADPYAFAQAELNRTTAKVGTAKGLGSGLIVSCVTKAGVLYWLTDAGAELAEITLSAEYRAGRPIVSGGESFGSNITESGGTVAETWAKDIGQAKSQLTKFAKRVGIPAMAEWNAEAWHARAEQVRTSGTVPEVSDHMSRDIFGLAS